MNDFNPYAKNIKIFSSREARLANYSGEDRVISSLDLQKELEEQGSRQIYNLKTSIPTLNQLIEGFETGELIIISGYTGHGKTSFCQSLTVDFWEKEIGVLWFSYEMPVRQFFSKFPQPLLFYLPRVLKDKALDWIEDRIIEAKAKYEVRVVMIDHLHFLVDMVKMKQPSLEIGTIVRALKGLAMRHNVVIFLIAHTSMPRGDMPGLDQIRDSSFIAQEADAVLVINRVQNKRTGVYENTAIVKILKHRRTGAMGKTVKVYYQNKRFYELTEEN